MNDLVRQKLCEIVPLHGRPLLTDPRLCESLLKDYCAQYKKEVFVLVCAVREQVAADLLASQDGVPREILRPLLIKRLHQNLALTEEASRWAVDSWAAAIRALLKAESNVPASDSNLKIETTPVTPPQPASLKRSLSPPTSLKPKGGIVGRCQGSVRAVAFSPDGLSIASGSDDARLCLWNIETGEMLVLSESGGPVSSIAFSPDGACLASASEGGASGSRPVVRIWEMASMEMLELGECGRRSPSIAFSPGGKTLASGCAETENSLRVWNLQTGQLRVFRNERGGLPYIAFAPDGKSIATADGSLTNPALRVWDLSTGRARILGHCSRQITGVAFAPDGKSIASGSWDETVRLWSAQTGKARILASNCSCICCLAYSPDGEKVAACSLDSRIRVWDVRTARSRTVGECQSVNAVAFSADSMSIVTGSIDGAIRLWNCS
jgi:WD40 repeat protein